MTVDSVDFRGLVPKNWEHCLRGRPCPAVIDSVPCAVTPASGLGTLARVLIVTVRTQAEAHPLSHGAVRVLQSY